MSLDALVDIYATFDSLRVISISIENIMCIKFNGKIITRVIVLDKMIVDLMSLFPEVYF
jgi:hypothetical protein